MNQEKVGKFIAQLRKEKKMTQQELADLLFVDRTTVSKWEVGNNSVSVDDLTKIANIFGITLSEMMIGEKQSEENVDKINTVTVNIIKKNKKFRRYLIYSCSFILILLIVFLSYYFITTYNSLVVYEINGEDNNFSIQNGLMIVSKDKTYIQLGSIKSIDNFDIESIKLYYKKNDLKINLIETTDSFCFYSSTYQNSELQYGDLKYLVPNLFLEVKLSNNEVSNIKLNLVKSYSNNKLYTKTNSNLEQDDINNLDNNIPTYIKENFKLDEEQHSYYLEESKDNKKIKYTYFYDVNVFIVEEIFDKYSESYSYLYPDDFSYSKSNSEQEVIDEFTYSITNKECIMGNCNNDIIEYFKSQYLNKLNVN